MVSNTTLEHLHNAELCVPRAALKIGRQIKPTVKVVDVVDTQRQARHPQHTTYIPCTLLVQIVDAVHVQHPKRADATHIQHQKKGSLGNTHRLSAPQPNEMTSSPLPRPPHQESSTLRHGRLSQALSASPADALLCCRGLHGLQPGNNHSDNCCCLAWLR
jgi:hypothetical protein